MQGLNASLSSLITPVAALAAKTARFLDATALLPGQPGDPDADFARERLPGAVRFDIEAFSDPASALPHMVPTQAQFARGMAALGLTRETPLIFYDRKGSIGACRAWWLAKLFGHESAFVLDGGLEAFRRAGGAVETGDAAQIVASEGYRPRPRFDFLAGTGDMLAALGDPAVLILDARSEARFLAEAPEPRPGVRGGHMPGAVSLPFGTVIDGEGRFLSPEALRAIFASCGLEGQTVITSCGSGLTAATLSVALVAAGLPQGRLYDGSWAEWGADSSLPVATF